MGGFDHSNGPAGSYGPSQTYRCSNVDLKLNRLVSDGVVVLEEIVEGEQEGEVDSQQCQRHHDLLRAGQLWKHGRNTKWRQSQDHDGEDDDGHVIPDPGR